MLSWNRQDHITTIFQVSCSWYHGYGSLVMVPWVWFYDHGTIGTQGQAQDYHRTIEVGLAQLCSRFTTIMVPWALRVRLRITTVPQKQAQHSFVVVVVGSPQSWYHGHLGLGLGLPWYHISRVSIAQQQVYHGTMMTSWLWCYGTISWYHDDVIDDVTVLQLTMVP